jgi:hypothetical protein
MSIVRPAAFPELCAVGRIGGRGSAAFTGDKNCDAAGVIPEGDDHRRIMAKQRLALVPSISGRLPLLGHRGAGVLRCLMSSRCLVCTFGMFPPAPRGCGSGL